MLPPLARYIAMPPIVEQVPPLLYPLANRFYRQYQRGTKANRQHHIWVIREQNHQQDHILCCGCLQPVDDGYWLTSLLVAPEHRRRRLASALLLHVRKQYSGPIWLFCAPDLKELYLQAGYQSASALPEALAARLARYQRHKPLIALVSR